MDTPSCKPGIRCSNLFILSNKEMLLSSSGCDLDIWPRLYASIGPFEWLFSSATFFRQKGQRSKVIHQKFDGEFFCLVSSTTEKNQTANRVRYNKT